MDFFNLDNYTLDDIQALIDNEVEENIHLDYKDGRALSKDDKKRTEITKDVSAFANSDGGIIIYGVSENNNKPQDFSPIDGNVYTKEWLEQVIMRIQRNIKDIKIYPIRIANDNSKTIYVVKIPRSNDSPHMADNHHYYKRFNFSSVQMEEYEVRDSFLRFMNPSLDIDGCAFYHDKGTYNNNNDQSYFKFQASIFNDSNNIGKYYKLNVIFISNLLEYMDLVYKPWENKLNYTPLDHFRLKVSLSSKEYIYPNETIQIGLFTVEVKKEFSQEFYDNLVIQLILFYEGGERNVVYIPSKRKFIEDKKEIEGVLREIEERIKKGIEYNN